jgi:hypothetical protein
MASPFESTDTYTQYELLEPGSAQFRVTYFVTERREGATLHLNGTRPGSEETDLSAEDMMTSEPISAELVSGPSLIAEGAGDEIGNGNASDPDSMFSRIELAREVAPGVEGRVRINKTYEDPLSYWVEDDGSVVFKRSLGIFRNSVVLPVGYALASSSINGEIMQLETGQVKVSFVNWHGYAADVLVKGTPIASPLPLSPAAPGTVEAAYNNTEAQYDLGAPGSGQYTITADVDLHRQDSYLDVPPSQQEPVLADISPLLASSWAAPAPAMAAMNLDTGEALEVGEGGSVGPLSPYGRLRLTATVDDPASYSIAGGELLFSRLFSAPRTTVSTAAPHYCVSVPCESPTMFRPLADCCACYCLVCVMKCNAWRWHEGVAAGGLHVDQGHGAGARGDQRWPHLGALEHRERRGGGGVHIARGEIAA